ncbi:MULTISPECIES: DUF3040 domain-containing protein [unclassified Streptomyces]|uniref:DUF3040 domain-containing protein n=1 Tax=unclassified Streptomyces TaxID=2593676 RepID=UPI001250C32E|nr:MULTISPECIES: DUF3040 domain-containing protein [unclassified Streptomyces]KAB2976511.1 DUF3040 domain-containing protein [Streptomyces sp. SS1-1]MDI9835475.1 DUF3040 domain-containing protein [Streptomyces sp. KAU_LT]
MPTSDDDRLVALETRLLRDDPRFVRRFRAGRPARPHEYRRTRAWWLLGVGLTTLGTGIAVADGLVIAAGLVLAGIAVERCDPQRTRGRTGRHDGRPPR